jgi:transketolase
MGGSADLETSTKTNIAVSARLTPDNYAGRNVFFGVREFAMAAAGNGLILHGGLRPFVSTFFVFSDYMKPAIRLASLMKLPLIYVFTHDSIGVGEDGPTHEPIEQLAALRVIPDMTVIRPADANETSQAWRYAVEQQHGPVALIFTRQNLANLEGTAELAKLNLSRGAYVLSDAKDGKPQAQLLASGSEVGLAMDAQKKLAEEGIQVRIVSMPSWELFEKQPKAYRDSVILPEVKARLGIEMAVSFGWDRYVGEQGDVLAINRFGASAPAPTVIKEYGFTVENVVAKVKVLLQ